MPYTQAASTLAPALIVYLIDLSNSMNEPCGDTTRLGLVQNALQSTLKDMVRRSMRNGQVLPRYHLAILTYNREADDVLGGIQPLSSVLKNGIPPLTARGGSDMNAGFTAVESLLTEHLGTYEHSPAPLVCHLTDGMFTTIDPAPVVRRIQRLSVKDGPVLIENIYLAGNCLRHTPADWREWAGISRQQDVTDEFSRYLLSISSPMPETYRNHINTYGYSLKQGALMMFPGTTIELIRLAFAISAATQFK